MLIPSGLRIHLAVKPTDFRKSIDGLSGVVRTVLDEDPLTGHLWVFHNRRRNALKLLFWDRGGFVMVYKRLERGRFKLPELGEGKQIRLSPAELGALLEGLDLTTAKRLPRWTPGLVDPWRSDRSRRGSEPSREPATPR